MEARWRKRLGSGKAGRHLTLQPERRSKPLPSCGAYSLKVSHLPQKRACCGAPIAMRDELGSSPIRGVSMLRRTNGRPTVDAHRQQEGLDPARKYSEVADRIARSFIVSGDRAGRGRVRSAAAFHLAWCAGVENLVAPVAMLGAGLSICDDALRHFAGKRVRVFPHDDEAGRNAGALWAAQLIAAGVEVDGYSFAGLSRADGHSVKDLNDFAHVHPDQWEEQRNIIEEAFSFALGGAPELSNGTANKTRAKGGIAGLWRELSNIRRTGRNLRRMTSAESRLKAIQQTKEANLAKKGTPNFVNFVSFVCRRGSEPVR